MRGVLVPFLCAVLTACAGEGMDGREVGVRVLASSLQCGRTKGASITEVRSREELSAQLPGPQSGDLVIEFNQERVFVINMGTRPTAGYGLNLAQPHARLDHNVVTIPLIWHEPAPGAITAQVITQPCLVVALEKRQYAEVRVVDQNGVERAQLSLR